MTITEKMYELLSTHADHIIQQTSSTDIAIMYYAYWCKLDMTKLTVYEYGRLVNKRTIPTFESVTRALRFQRERNVKWRKPADKVTTQVDHIREQSRT